MAMGVGFVISPICGSTVAKYVNFDWAAWGLAIYIFVSSFLLLFLREIKEQSEEKDTTETTSLLGTSIE
eukprot:m.60923 g.60923  ORF g.60923 m.60923 type:complete len:69 (+) comp34954_c0_seq1:1171-1377(+)